MRGELRPEQINLTIQSIIAYGIERPELRDEIFCQIIRQSTDCPRDDWLLRVWQFMSRRSVSWPILPPDTSTNTSPIETGYPLCTRVPSQNVHTQD